MNEIWVAEFWPISGFLGGTPADFSPTDEPPLDPGDWSYPEGDFLSKLKFLKVFLSHQHVGFANAVQN